MNAKRYVVELEPGVFVADRDGDPGRTLSADHAAAFDSRKAAKLALDGARRYRPFVGASIVPLTRQ